MINCIDLFNQCIVNLNYTYSFPEYALNYFSIINRKINHEFLELITNLFKTEYFININTLIYFNVYENDTEIIKILHNKFNMDIDYIISNNENKIIYFISKKIFEYFLFNTVSDKEIILNYFLIKILYGYYNKYIKLVNEKKDFIEKINDMYFYHSTIYVELIDVKKNINNISDLIAKLYLLIEKFNN